MKLEVDQNIVNALKQYSTQGMSFYQAKQELLKQGYKDEDIELAEDNYNYGDKPKPPDPVTKLFEEDPQATEKVGEDMLKDDQKQREEQSIAEGIAGQHSVDLQSDLKYQNKFLNGVGTSWWTWIVIEIVVSGVIYLLELPEYCYGISIIVLVIAFAIKKT